MKQQRHTWMRGVAAVLGASALVAGLSGCIVLPLPHARGPGVVVVEGHGGPHDRRGDGRYDDRYDGRRDGRRDGRGDGRY